MKDAAPEAVSLRHLASALVFLGGSALLACIDAPEFRQVDTSATEPAPSATQSADTAPAPVTPGRKDDDDDDDDDRPTPPTPPAADAGTLCGGKVCQSNQMCCENKCKGGNKC